LPAFPWKPAPVLVVLFSACATVQTHVSPEGNIVLGRDRITLELPTRGMTILESRVGGELIDPYVLASNDATGLTVSASLEPAAEGDCLEQYWSRLLDIPGFQAEGVVPQVRGSFQVIAYTLSESPDPLLAGVRVNQRNLVGCTTLEGTTAFVHLSKARYSAEDETLFVSAFEAIKLERH